MLGYKRLAIAVATAFVLITGYELGRISRLPDARERTISTSFTSGSAPTQTDAPNTWQKIAARSKAAHNKRGEQAAELPTGLFGSNISALRKLADAGNADAAYALAKGYRDCEFFVPPKDDSEVAQRAEDSTVMQLNVFDQIVDQVKSAAEKQGKSIGKVPEVAVQPVYQGNLRAGQEQVRQCTGVDTAIARDWMEWQRRAAELGNLEAELTYWILMVQNADVRSVEDLVQDKQVASAALQDALSRGDPRALIAIGEVLQNGWFAEADPYLAYAYFYGASQAPYANINTLPWIGQSIFAVLANGNNTQTYLQQHLDRVSASLTPAQQLAAQQLGLSLFQQCCKGSGA
jgi:hypothetical protein